MEGEEFTLFDYFVEENKNAFRVEVKFILDRLETIGQMYGARENYFKLHEGRSGDGVSALYDLPGKELRLFCILYGTEVVILGGGGPKTPGVIVAWQDDPKLKKEAEIMIRVSAQVTQRIRSREILIAGNQLMGNLIFMEE